MVGLPVLLADDAACEDQCLAVRVEVVASVDAVLGLVDGVLVAVDQGDFAPVFFEVRFGADAYPVLSMGVSFRSGGLRRAGCRTQ